MRKNPYESLKSECLEDVLPVPPHNFWKITKARDEIIIIYTSRIDTGAWVAGYDVYWKNGRNSFLGTSAANGLFRSEHDAQLYMVGFMKVYLNYFTEDTQKMILKAESDLLQIKLF